MPTELQRRRHIRLGAWAYDQTGAMASLTICTHARRPLFASPTRARIVHDEIRRLHGDRWRMLGYCIMPDHLHLLVCNLSDSIVDLVRLFKGRTSATLRRGLDGPIWQRSFYDHLLRRDEHIVLTLRYLVDNPVRAGLVDFWDDYPWSGSCEWPDLGLDVFTSNPADFRWHLPLPPPDDSKQH